MPRYKQEGIETARIGVVLPKEIRLRLEQVAKSKDWSVSQTAATAIEEWLDLVETPSPVNKKQANQENSTRQIRSVASLTLDDLEQG